MKRFSRYVLLYSIQSHLLRSDNERYRNGTGVALCSMAAADLCSLLLICAQNLQQFFISQKSSETFLMQATCKVCPPPPLSSNPVLQVMLFLTHTVTGVSIWSWLLLSCLRYLAIRHPLYHLRLWQMPYRALAFIIVSRPLTSLRIRLMSHYVRNIYFRPLVRETDLGVPGDLRRVECLAAGSRPIHGLRVYTGAADEELPSSQPAVPPRGDMLVLLHPAGRHYRHGCQCHPQVNVGVPFGQRQSLPSSAFPRWRNNKMRRKSALEEIIKLTRSSSMRIKVGVSRWPRPFLLFSTATTRPCGSG